MKVKRSFFSAILLGLVLLLSACSKGDNTDESYPNPIDESDPNPIDESYPYPDGKVFFTHPPIDISGAQYFIGIGAPNVLPKDHGGFALAAPYVFPASVPVLAVADGVIIRASNGTRAVPPIPDAPENLWGREYDDHLLVLKVSTDVQVNYAHITTFHPTLAAELGNIPKDEVGHNVAVQVQGGDTLGF